MKAIKRLAIFCGAATGNRMEYIQVATEFAELLVQNEITLVYGGANIGVMGVLANHMMALGGKVIGVMPQSLRDKEIAHTDISELHVVNSMHERKALIEKLSDGFVMLPGGVGSLDEFFEIFTWMKLGIHHKPCAILNIANYYDLLIEFLKVTVTNGFMEKIYLDAIIIDKSPLKLIERLQAYQHSIPVRWYHQSSEQLIKMEQ